MSRGCQVGVELDNKQLHQVSQGDWHRLSGAVASRTRAPRDPAGKVGANLSPFPSSLSLKHLARARRRETPSRERRGALSAGMRGAMGCDGIAPLSRHLSASHAASRARVRVDAHSGPWQQQKKAPFSGDVFATSQKHHRIPETATTGRAGHCLSRLPRLRGGHRLRRLRGRRRRRHSW